MPEEAAWARGRGYSARSSSSAKKECLRAGPSNPRVRTRWRKGIHSASLLPVRGCVLPLAAHRSAGCLSGGGIFWRWCAAGGCAICGTSHCVRRRGDPAGRRARAYIGRPVSCGTISGGCRRVVVCIARAVIIIRGRQRRTQRLRGVGELAVSEMTRPKSKNCGQRADDAMAAGQLRPELTIAMSTPGLARRAVSSPGREGTAGSGPGRRLPSHSRSAWPAR